MTNQTITGVRNSRWLFKSKRGQSLVEYALILAFISVLSVIYMSGLSEQIRNLYLPIISALQAAQQSIQ